VLVFVAFYASDPKNRLLATHSSIWDVALTTRRGRVAPTAIDVIRSSPAVVDVFPWIDRFDDLYLLRFARSDPSGAPLLGASENLSLQVRSALADCAVSWSLVE
jgi:hypothetical protein